MQAIIALWCYLIGITDPVAIEVATGVAAIGLAVLVIRGLVYAVSWLIGAAIAFIQEWA